ncbi:G2/M phase-specific E3 ubiquitin-protein ligase [Geodia barretti]|uniref:G2/M phase-specific E3 ubiquitin-protein ligase n=1 Tax=Geodia barretti TaxID=519541 RepID=A0AA35SR50_GEOBA|nr:G2/M phase-specific E3 ubiquitin-protein ligase [Geodia barretti]
MVYILFCSLPESLNDVINHLKLNVTQETHEYNVRRDEVFSDMMREAKKRSFSPYKRVKTYFVGEQGNDTGGLTRELWCLFARHVQHNLCEGHENCKVIRHDASKLQEGVYRRVGVLMGVSLIQGGSGYPFFAPSTFSYLSGTDVCSILVGCDEIPDIEVKKTLQEIRSASDDNALQEIASNVCDVLISCGYTKPIALLKHEDIPTVIECVSLHSAILKVKAELDEIGKGLADAGVLQMLQKYPHFFRSLFVYEECVLTAEKMITLLEKRTFSENGSSQLVKEKTTYIHFCDLLEELEGGIEMEGERIVTLGDCLSFFTGAQRIPPTGFIQACTLNFSDSNVYPTASTCALILTLPTLYHNSYSCFKEKMLFAFCNHGGFGLC